MKDYLPRLKEMEREEKRDSIVGGIGIAIMIIALFIGITN